MQPWLQTLRDSRLLHFCILGGVIFVAALHGDRRRVDISEASLSVMRTSEAARIAPAPMDPTRAGEVSTRAIEDETMSRNEGAVVLGSFQAAHHFEDSADRWNELARTADWLRTVI